MATSSASLDRSPKHNWVEDAGGLPPYVRKIARAIHEKRGIPLSQAIPYAIGRLKKWAAGGDGVSGETQAKAAAAIAAWERLKSKAGKGKLTEAEALGVHVLDDNLGIPTALLLEWLEDDGPLVEAAIRRAIRRLPDGTFAPRGTGSVLNPGDKVDVPHRSGHGTVPGVVKSRDSRGKARVELLDGPDKGGSIDVKPAPPAGVDRSAGRTPYKKGGVPNPAEADVTDGLRRAAVQTGPEPGKRVDLDADGNRIRLRRESTGAWVVETKKRDQWLPMRFTPDEAGRRAAEAHFKAQQEGGALGAARHQAALMPDPDRAQRLANRERNRAAKGPGGYTSELYRDSVGHEVWRIRDPQGKVIQSGIASDHDMRANLDEYNAARGRQRAENAEGAGTGPPPGVGPPEPGSPAAKAMGGYTEPQLAMLRDFGIDPGKGKPVRVLRRSDAYSEAVERGTPPPTGDVSDARLAAQLDRGAKVKHVIVSDERWANRERKRGRANATRAQKIASGSLKLFEAATPPARVDLRLKSGRTVNVTAEHARRLHREGRAESNQRPGDNPKGFDEKKHPRGGKGSTAGGKFVKSGSSGTEVRAVQRRVGARVDGEFGARTLEAVKRFQKAHGLTVDGVVGRQTVAALRGRSDAKRVKTGELSKRDREYLAGHIRGTGRQRRRTDGEVGAKQVTSLVEAVAPAQFLDRVRSLELGEMARLPDGCAVKHHSSEDGRALWTAGNPSGYGNDSSVYWREARRTAEEAVADALTRSAATTDPASIAGTTRLRAYSSIVVNGRPATFVGVTATGLPLVRYDGLGEPVPAAWHEVAPAPRA